MRKPPIQLDAHSEMLMEQYRKQLPSLQLLAKQAYTLLSKNYCCSRYF